MNELELYKTENTELKAQLQVFKDENDMSQK